MGLGSLVLAFFEARERDSTGDITLNVEQQPWWG